MELESYSWGQPIISHPVVEHSPKMFLARTTVRCEKLKEVQPKPGQTTFHVRQVNRLNAGLLRNGFTGEVNLERRGAKPLRTALKREEEG